MRRLNQAIILFASTSIIGANPLRQGDEPAATPGEHEVLTNTDCGPAPSGYVGGVFGCIPYVPPAAPSTTVATITATAPGQDGKPQTDLVTWTVSDVVVTATGEGADASTPTTVPAWVCTGDLCNPDCLVPDVSCEGQDGPGANGFPWPEVRSEFFMV